MPIGEIISVGYGLGKTLGINLGGSSEAGTGTTQPNTLAHAIDKFEKANDYEAVELARKAVQMAVNGDTEQEIEAMIANELGYTPGSMLPSHKWDYVSQMLDQATAKAMSATQTGTAGNQYAISGAPATQAGFSWGPLLLIAAVIGGLLYWNQ